MSAGKDIWRLSADVEVWEVSADKDVWEVSADEDVWVSADVSNQFGCFIPANTEWSPCKHKLKRQIKKLSDAYICIPTYLLI